MCWSAQWACLYEIGSPLAAYKVQEEEEEESNYKNQSLLMVHKVKTVVYNEK